MPDTPRLFDFSALLTDSLCAALSDISFSLAKFLNMRGSKHGNSMLQRLLGIFCKHRPKPLRPLVKSIIAATRLSLDVHSTNKRGQTILHMLCDAETYHLGVKSMAQTGCKLAEEATAASLERRKVWEAQYPTMEPARSWYHNRGRKLTEGLLSIALRKGADLYKPDSEGQLLLERNRSLA